MKRILTILFLLCFTAAFGQRQQGLPSRYRTQGIQNDSVFSLPMDTVLRVWIGERDTAQVRYNRTDSSVYVWNGRKWLKVGTGATDTSGIRVRLTGSDYITITGTYPNQTISGNPDTLIAGANITLSPSGTKKVTISANTASLDSLYGGKVDSVVQRGDTLRYFIGADSTLVGVISGGGGGTLQEAYDADPLKLIQVDSIKNDITLFRSISNIGDEVGNYGYFANSPLISSQNPNLGDDSRIFLESGNNVQIINSNTTDNNISNSSFQSTRQTHTYYSNTDSTWIIVSNPNKFVKYNASGTGIKFGINVPTDSTPSTALHVVGAPRFATDSAAAGYVWTSKDATGQGEWRVISGGGGGTLQEAYDNSTAPQINTGTGVFNVVGDDGINIADFGISADQTSISHTLNNGSGAGSKMQITPQLFAATIQNHTGNATEFMIDSTDAYFFNAAYPVNLGINTRTPTAPLHVVGAPRFATDSAAAGYVWTSKDATGQGEWRAASISSGVTSSQLTDSLNSRFGTIITDSIKIGNSWYYDAKVTLTASQIYTLNSSPVIATTAPGAGYSLTVTSAALVYNAGATPFNLDNNFYVIINNGTVYETTSQIVLSNVVTQNIVMMPVVQGIGSLDENQPISIQGEVDVAGGDGTVTIYLSYKKTQL